MATLCDRVDIQGMGEQNMQLMKQTELPAIETLMPMPEYLTYGATVDENNVEHEITELMIRRACETMHDMQQYPFSTVGGFCVRLVKSADIHLFEPRSDKLARG
jgi:hypothetical protein